MFEEYTLTNTVVQKDELPLMIRIGGFQRQATKVPVLMPIDIMNGLCFETNSDMQVDALRQMQYIAIDLIKQVNPEVLKLSFVDFGLTTNFPLLHSIKMPNVKFITNIDELKKELNFLFEKSRFISTQCLKADFANLREYNAKSAYKESYNFLFIANFPKDCRAEEIDAICELINGGAKCGIQVIMSLDKSQLFDMNSYNRVCFNKIIKLVNGITCIDCLKAKAELKNFNVKVIQKWFDKYPFQFDNYPVSEINDLVDTLYKIQDKTNTQVDNFLSIPIGQCGRERICLEMGQKAGVYHGLIAGQSGTGKSTLLNNIITSIAEKYSPDEMRLYLLDYKLGVEFKIYKDHPNVELLLLDNNRLSAAVEALKRLENEMTRREKLFEAYLTIQDIDAYNKKSKEKLPRILIIIDEVQQLFKDYETQRKINPLIKSIAKQGRSFGIHMLFSSQSYDGCNISSDILAQMSLRIAFTLASGQECRAIFGGDNEAAKTIPHYSAVYNTRNGNKDGNIIVKMDNFDRNIILPTLKAATEHFKGYKSFEKVIITRDTVLRNEEQSGMHKGCDYAARKKCKASDDDYKWD